MKPAEVARKPVPYKGSGSGSGSGSWKGRKPIRSLVKQDPSDMLVDPDFFTKFRQLPPYILSGLGDSTGIEANEEEKEKEIGKGLVRHRPLHKCLICGRLVSLAHNPSNCPYLRFVPHKATLPPGIQRFCKCCHLRDGHPGRDDWKGYACFVCEICGAVGDHWAEQCPDNDSNDE